MRAGRIPGAPGGGRPPVVRALTLDGMFSAAARRHPDAVVVREGRRVLSYGRAEERAARLASALVRHGLQLGDPVVVHCADHRQSVVAQLAVLKAGGVCVPVPRDARGAAGPRVSALTGARAVLCGGFAVPLWRHHELVVDLDDAEVWRRVGALEPEPSLPHSGPVDAAYLLTPAAEPNGYLTDHRAWQYHLAARVRAAGPAGLALTATRGPGTPAALSALWWAVAGGGTYVPWRPGLLVAGGSAGSRVAVFSPEEYGRVLKSVRGGTPPFGTAVVLGGACPPELVAHHFDALPGVRLRAEFAPAGGALPWTARDLSPLPDGGASGVGVGRPLPHVRVWAVDGDGTPLPPGCVGELVASGPAVPFESLRPRCPALGDEGAEPMRSSWLGLRRANGTVEVTARGAGHRYGTAALSRQAVGAG
ncbi:AMP-binding protein [Streptomyces thermolilacinus]|uniref:AMP-binding protein n=1 Tax=Streptomyces thermolilacinus TaxID=285540 RepID=UPI001112E746|nr:AMP-binding protein [Streptomyces thermolilacinus]